MGIMPLSIYTTWIKQTLVPRYSNSFLSQNSFIADMVCPVVEIWETHNLVYRILVTINRVTSILA